MSFSIYLREPTRGGFKINLYFTSPASTAEILASFCIKATTIQSVIGAFSIYVEPVIIPIIRTIDSSGIKLAKISDEIIRNYNLINYTIGSINFWIRSNISKLNNYSNTNYSITNDGYITPNIDNNDKIILFKIFEEYYYNKLAKDATSASNYNISIEVSEDNDSVKRINRTEIYKTYNRLAKSSRKELNKLINNMAYDHGLNVHGKEAP